MTKSRGIRPSGVIGGVYWTALELISLELSLIWRRGELNPCPRRFPRRHLHVYPALGFREPTLHRRTAVSRVSTKFLHRPARSLRRTISLLSTFGAVAGVQLQTSRSIKPRERDLGDLRLFVLVRFLTRPTNRPRHAACASNNESKPVRPLLVANLPDCDFFCNRCISARGFSVERD